MHERISSFYSPTGRPVTEYYSGLIWCERTGKELGENIENAYTPANRLLEQNRGGVLPLALLESYDRSTLLSAAFVKNGVTLMDIWIP